GSCLHSHIRRLLHWPRRSVRRHKSERVSARRVIVLPGNTSHVGGLLLSQLLTLFTTPVVYLYLDRLGGFLRHKRVAILDSRSSSTSRV
ncbi:MAG TPA: hypothetical protein VFO87_04150, partial [Nitrospira sp.]|nr:hypothetical protein [Nitrospira sp.]